MPGGIDAHVHLCQDLKTGPHGLGGGAPTTSKLAPEVPWLEALRL
jgi:hypothetical protein